MTDQSPLLWQREKVREREGGRGREREKVSEQERACLILVKRQRTEIEKRRRRNGKECSFNLVSLLARLRKKRLPKEKKQKS